MFSRLASTSPRYLAASSFLISGPFGYYSYRHLRPLHNDAPHARKAEGNSLSWANTGYREKVLPSGKIQGTGAKQEDKDDGSWFADGEDAAWATFSNKFAEAGTSLVTFEWSAVGDKLTDLIIPTWAKTVPGYVRKLQSELTDQPGSLVHEIWTEAEDPTINPEIEWNARVRISKELCKEEQAFRLKRKEHTRVALAQYLGLPVDEVHPEDVPTIAMCGSGGGLRALVAGASSYLSAQEAGLFDCVTYTAGVSGSCWLQTLYHSSIARQNFHALINHLKKRIGTHIAFPPPALNLLATSPTNKFLLSGLMEKVKADPEADFGLVDIYGLLLGARLLVPRGELEVDPRDLKISNQRAHTDNGSSPLPIYTAVRHVMESGHTPSESERLELPSKEAMLEKEKETNESWFQWFEWTPYEFWCDEIEAGIPTWALGRQFQNGVNVPRENGLELPELRLPQLLGIWGSAFCATLSHYYKEVRPIIKGITGFGGIDDLISDRDEDLAKVHPFDPATIPNFVRGLETQLPATTPKSMISASHLQLMDAGMSNNLPIYPLLRPGRDVDVIIAFDASADIKQENWLSVADGVAKQRGIQGWPVGLGWPTGDESTAQTQRELEVAQATTTKEASEKLREAKGEQDQQVKGQNQESKDTNSKELGYCTVWIGTTEQRSEDHPDEHPPSKRIDDSNPDDWETLRPEDSGIAVIYFPLIPNDQVPGVDPQSTPFLSTWNFIYTPEEIDKVVQLARANFDQGKDQTRRCVRAVYERKKRMRLEREESDKQEKWRRRFKGDGDQFGVGAK